MTRTGRCSTVISAAVSFVAALSLVASTVMAQSGGGGSGVAVTITAQPDSNIPVNSVRDGGVVVTFSSSVNWNVSCIFAKFSDSLFIVTPLSHRFGFSVDNVFPSYATTSVSTQTIMQTATGRPTALELQLGGPAPRYLPEDFVEAVTIRFPPSCFQTSGSTASSVTPVTIHLVAPDDRSTEANVVLVASCTIAVGAVLSGSAGWIGLSALQSFVVMGNSTCAETYTSKYFEEAVKIVSVPFASLSDTLVNADIFGVSIGVCLGLLAIHILVATLVHRCYFGGASRTTWRAVSQKLYFPGPFLFTCVYLWLGITVTAYREVVEAESGTLARPALIVAWAVFAGMLAILWYDGLKRGFDGHFELYPWYESQTQRLEHTAAGSGASGSGGDGLPITEAARQEMLLQGGPFQFFQRFGRFQFLLLPKGRWMNTRGYGILRSNCDDGSYQFAPLTLVAVAAFGAVVVNNTECDWYFGSIIIVECIYLITFFLIRPFRIPLLNLVWLAMKLTVLVIAALHLYWLENAVEPNDATALSIRLACIAFIGLCGVFVGYNLMTNAIERSIQTSARLRELVEGVDEDEAAADELRTRQSTLLGFLGINRHSPEQRQQQQRAVRRRSVSPAASATMKDLELHFINRHDNDNVYNSRGDVSNDLLDLYRAPPPLLPPRVARDDRDHRSPEAPSSAFLDSIFGVGQHSGENGEAVEVDGSSLPLQDVKPGKAARDRSWAEVPPVRIPGGPFGDQELEEILVDMHLRLGPARPGARGGDEAGERPHAGGGGGVQEFIRERHYRKHTQFVRAREEVRNMLTHFWWHDDPTVGQQLEGGIRLLKPTEAAQQHGHRPHDESDDERMQVVRRHSVTYVGRPNTYSDETTSPWKTLEAEQQRQKRVAVASESYGVLTKPVAQRVAVKVEPISTDASTTNELAFLMEAITGPGTVLDMSVVGRAVFAGIRGLGNAQAIGTAMHNRELFGQVVQCTVIEDAMATRLH